MEHFARLLFSIVFFLSITACGGGGDSTPADTQPIVNAGIDQTVNEGLTVSLLGTGSDADGGVTFSWVQTGGISVTLSNSALSNPTFTAPVVTGTIMLTFELTVTDSTGNSVIDTVLITILNFDSPPTVNAGPDQTVNEGDPVSLAGSGSDSEGPVTFSWTQTAGTTVTLSDTTISNPGFIAPNVPSDEVLTFTLTVTDNGGNSEADSVAIRVLDTDNTLPLVNAGPDQTVDEGDPVSLAGSGSDAEGPVTLSWSQIAGTTVTLSDSAIANPTFTAPAVSVDEVLTFRLTVTDNVGAVVFDDVSITVNDTDAPPPPAPLSYLFYSNSLNAVDPSNPTAPALIEPTADLVQTPGGFRATAEIFRFGTVDIPTKVITNEHNYAVIYPSTDGRIYKVSALIAGSLAPVQVSNESQADQICTNVIGGSAVHTDLANVDNSVYLYVLPGPDTNCDTNDDVWKMVRLGMGATDAPVLAKKVVQDLHDANTAALAGWLVHDSGELQRCDVNFAGCTTVTTVTDSADWRVQATFDNMLLEIDDELHIYSETANTLSPSRFSIPAGTVVWVPDSDGTTLYFANGNILYQMPADGSADATVLRTETNDIRQVYAASNTVVYQEVDAGRGVEIKSIAKAGGTPVSLATAGTGEDLLLLYVKGDMVYYNSRIIIVTPVYTIQPVLAGVINENGTGQVEYTEASWSGGIFKTTYDADLTIRLGELLDKTFLIEGYDIAGTSGGLAGTTVREVDAATGSVGLTIGTLPTTTNIISFQCYGFGADALCSSLNAITPTPALPALPFQNDVYYVNSDTASSLDRVTNTTDESEVTLF